MLSSHRTAFILSAAVTSLVCTSLAHAYTIKMPWRGDSLPQGSYMRTSGHGGYDCGPGGGTECSLDISAVRWDAAAQTYTTSRTTASNATTTADHVTWEMPLYSPVDGEVVSCWWNMPEDNDDGSEPAGCDPVQGCMDGGNHLIIRTYDGHYVNLLHMRQGSIPNPTSGGKVLCPIPAAESVVQQSSPKACNIPGQGGARTIARLDKRGFAPIKVKKGDFLGRVGNSGGSEKPHLHMSVGAMTLDAQSNYCMAPEEVVFTEAFTQPMLSGVAPTHADWTPLGGEYVGAPLTIDGSKQLLWADPIGARTDGVEIEAGNSPAVSLHAGGGVSAYRDLAGNLNLVGFRVAGDDSFDLGVARQEGFVFDLALAHLDLSSHVLVAVRDASDRLTVTPYFVRSNADLVKGVPRTEATVGVGMVEATRAPTHSGAVVAVKNSQGRISVIDYATSLSGEQLSVTRKGSAASTQAIADLDVATVKYGRGLDEDAGAFKGVVTVERALADDSMWLRSWQISSDGASVVQTDSALATSVNNGLPFVVSDVDVTVTGGFDQREIVVVSAATAAGLRVQTWQISSTGQLARVEQYDGGAASQLASARTALQDVVVGLRTGSGGLSLVAFHVEASGSLRRGGTRDAGGVSAVALDGGSGHLVVFTPSSADQELALLHHTTHFSANY